MSEILFGGGGGVGLGFCVVGFVMWIICLDVYICFVMVICFLLGFKVIVDMFFIFGDLDIIFCVFVLRF